MSNRAHEAAGAASVIRALAAQDLPAVVDIDASGGQRTRRRAYFERRLAAALDNPTLHVQCAAERGGDLVGFALARRLAGEFGEEQPALRLEVIGVRADAQGAGIGTQLLAHLLESARQGGATEVRTQVSWRDVDMLRFLAHTDFALARNHVLDCAVRAARFDDTDHDASTLRATGESWKTPETDYSAASGNDFEALGRDLADVRSLTPEDFEGVARIDRRVTGSDRRDYLRRVFDEALGNAGVRASLVAHSKGMAVGFVMAKTDFGDFGRTEPVAVLDTIGVDPDFGGQGIGRALLSQLFLNLQALRVERLETVVARGDFTLLRFLYGAGFAPAERLAFVRSAVK